MTSFSVCLGENHSENSELLSQNMSLTSLDPLCSSRIYLLVLSFPSISQIFIASNHQYPQATYISTFLPWYHFLSPFLHLLLTFLVSSDLKIPCFNFQYPTFQLSPKSNWMSHRIFHLRCS